MATPRKKPEDKLKVGRPSKYTPELARIICDIVATNPHGLKRLCDEHDNIPTHDTINKWRWEHPEFSSQYQVAKQHQTDLVAEECGDIAQESEYYIDAQGNRRIDPGSVAHRKLMVDTKKWHISKLAPRKYGNDIALEHVSHQQEEVLAEVKKIQADLKKKSKKPY